MYKPLAEFASDEMLGFQQAMMLFQKRKIYLIHPKGLETAKLHDWALQYHSNLETVTIDDFYFSKDRSGYSRMLTSLWFYKLFEDFDFILIHQLDAFVFRDELDIWMERNYDYIGGPMLYEHCNSVQELREKALVGNGGLSLRKTQTFIRLLEQNPVIRSTKRLISQYKADYKGNPLKILLRLSILPLMAIGFRNRLNDFVRRFNVHEDYVWCDYVATQIQSFKVAPLEEAANFSLDGFPRQVAHLLNIDCPMGCHAWKRYDSEFWHPLIAEIIKS